MKELNSWQKKHRSKYRKAWRKRLPEEKKAKIRVYHKEYMRKWREAHPERARTANRKAYLTHLEKERVLNPKPVGKERANGPAVVEETMPGHCKRCGILLSERGTPDGKICFSCHNELIALL